MPPTRNLAVVPMPARNAPQPYAAYKNRASTKCTGVGHIRPRDLAAEPKPPRVPTTPSELFTAALLDKDRLGLKNLKGIELLNNVTIDLSVEELRGEVEGIYEDPSTWTLVLRLRPDMFMSPLVVTLEDFTGDPAEYRAPIWLGRLEGAPGRYRERVRSYKWLEAFVFKLLTTPYTKVPRVRTWGDILTYVWRIKEVCEPRARPRDPSRPLPKPRRVRSGNSLVAAMSALILDDPGEERGERDSSRDGDASR